jgi:hypothetical protein
MRVGLTIAQETVQTVLHAGHSPESLQLLVWGGAGG